MTRAGCNQDVALTFCPGKIHLNSTSTSGSPNTVQSTLMLSPPFTLLDDARMVVDGGPLGTGRKQERGHDTDHPTDGFCSLVHLLPH